MHIMKPLKVFDIQFVGLKLGVHSYEFDIDQTFFEHFEYNEFNDSKVKIRLQLQKKTTLLELSFEAEGTVNVMCDLTNEPFHQPLQASFDLVVKFGEDYNDEYEDILILPHGAYEVNIAQYIYELIVLALPQKRIHPGVVDGTLNSEILDKLEDLSPKNSDHNPNADTDPRWDSLKQLLTDK